MTERLTGLVRYMWPEKRSASVLCMARAGRTADCEKVTAEKIGYAAACRKARAHTRETGHDTRVRHERITEYSATEGNE